MTRAMAIIGRAKEIMFVAASQTPWWELTSSIGFSGSSRSSLTAAGLASETSRCSRQFSFVTTPGTQSASAMWPARWHHAFRAMRFASRGSSVTPPLRMFSTERRRRRKKNGQISAANPAPIWYACLWRNVIE